MTEEFLAVDRVITFTDAVIFRFGDFSASCMDPEIAFFTYSHGFFVETPVFVFRVVLGGGVVEGDFHVKSD